MHRAVDIEFRQRNSMSIEVAVPHIEHPTRRNGGLCTPHGASRTSESGLCTPHGASCKSEWWSLHPTSSISHVGMAVDMPHIGRLLDTIVSQKKILIPTECGEGLSVDSCGLLAVGAGRFRKNGKYLRNMFIRLLREKL